MSITKEQVEDVRNSLATEFDDYLRSMAVMFNGYDARTAKRVQKKVQAYLDFIYEKSPDPHKLLDPVRKPKCKVVTTNIPSIYVTFLNAEGRRINDVFSYMLNLSDGLDDPKRRVVAEPGDIYDGKY